MKKAYLKKKENFNFKKLIKEKRYMKNCGCKKEPCKKLLAVSVSWYLC